MSSSHRPYHLYPLLGIVMLVIGVLAIRHRLKEGPPAGTFPAPR